MLIDTIISGLILAAIGGLGVIAYNKPKLYLKYGLILFGLAHSAVWICIIYNIGISNGFFSAYKYVKLEDMKKAEIALDAAKIPYIGTAITLVTLVFGGLLLFSFIMANHDEKNN